MSREMRAKRCPRCGKLSFSARTVPPWPCPFCGAECFYVPDEPLTPEEEKAGKRRKKPERGIDAPEDAKGLAASCLAK